MVECPRVRHPAGPREWLWWGLIMLLALGLRLGRWSEERAGPQALAPSGDEGTYDRWAMRLAAGQAPAEVPYMAPAQAWTLAAWHEVLSPGPARDAQRLLQALMGVGTVLLTGLVARSLGGPRVAWVAAAAVALHLPLVYYETTLLRDGPATFWMALAALAACRLLASGPTAPRWLAARGLQVGLVSGLASLWRENLQVVAMAGLLLLLPWVTRRRGPERAARAGAWLAAALGLLLPLLPLLRANAALEGRWSPLPTWNGGCVFYLSNRAEVQAATYQLPAFVRQATPEGEREGFRAEAERRAGGPLTPHQVSGFWLRRGLVEVLRDAPGYLRKVLARTGWFVASGELVHARDLVLDREESRVLRLPGVGFGLLVGFACLGAWRERSRPPARALAALCALLLLSTVAVAFSSRYRLPAVPLLATLAALGARSAVQALRQGRPWALAVGLGLALACTWLPVPYTPSQRVVGRLNRALTWMALDRPALAFAELEQLPPGAAAASGWTRLAAALLDNAAPDLAVRATSRALAQAPDQGEVWLQHALALERLDPGGPETEPAFARAAVLAPQSSLAWAGLARCRARRGDLDGARAAQLRARELLRPAQRE